MNKLTLTTSVLDVDKNPEFKKFGGFGKLRVLRHQHTNYDEVRKSYNKSNKYMELMDQMKQIVDQNFPELSYYMDKHYNDKLEMNK